MNSFSNLYEKRTSTVPATSPSGAASLLSLLGGSKKTTDGASGGDAEASPSSGIQVMNTVEEVKQHFSPAKEKKGNAASLNTGSGGQKASGPASGSGSELLSSSGSDGGRRGAAEGKAAPAATAGGNERSWRSSDGRPRRELRPQIREGGGIAAASVEAANSKHPTHEMRGSGAGSGRDGAPGRLKPGLLQSDYNGRDRDRPKDSAGRFGSRGSYQQHHQQQQQIEVRQTVDAASSRTPRFASDDEWISHMEAMVGTGDRIRTEFPFRYNLDEMRMIGRLMEFRGLVGEGHPPSEKMEQYHRLKVEFLEQRGVKLGYSTVSTSGWEAGKGSGAGTVLPFKHKLSSLGQQPQEEADQPPPGFAHSGNNSSSSNSGNLEKWSKGAAADAREFSGSADGGKPGKSSTLDLAREVEAERMRFQQARKAASGGNADGMGGDGAAGTCGNAVVSSEYHAATDNVMQEMMKEAAVTNRKMRIEAGAPGADYSPTWGEGSATKSKGTRGTDITTSLGLPVLPTGAVVMGDAAVMLESNASTAADEAAIKDLMGSLFMPPVPAAGGVSGTGVDDGIDFGSMASAADPAADVSGSASGTASGKASSRLFSWVKGTPTPDSAVSPSPITISTTNSATDARPGLNLGIGIDVMQGQSHRTDCSHNHNSSTVKGLSKSDSRGDLEFIDSVLGGAFAPSTAAGSAGAADLAAGLSLNTSVADAGSSIATMVLSRESQNVSATGNSIADGNSSDPKTSTSEATDPEPMPAYVKKLTPLEQAQQRMMPSELSKQRTAQLVEHHAALKHLLTVHQQGAQREDIDSASAALMATVKVLLPRPAAPMQPAVVEHPHSSRSPTGASSSSALEAVSGNHQAKLPPQPAPVHSSPQQPPLNHPHLQQLPLPVHSSPQHPPQPMHPQPRSTMSSSHPPSGGVGPQVTLSGKNRNTVNLLSRLGLTGEARTAGGSAPSAGPGITVLSADSVSPGAEAATEVKASSSVKGEPTGVHVVSFAELQEQQQQEQKKNKELQEAKSNAARNSSTPSKAAAPVAAPAGVVASPFAFHEATTTGRPLAPATPPHGTPAPTGSATVGGKATPSTSNPTLRRLQLMSAQKVGSKTASPADTSKGGNAKLPATVPAAPPSARVTIASTAPAAPAPASAAPSASGSTSASKSSVSVVVGSSVRRVNLQGLFNKSATSTPTAAGANK